MGGNLGYKAGHFGAGSTTIQLCFGKNFPDSITLYITPGLKTAEIYSTKALFLGPLKIYIAGQKLYIW